MGESGALHISITGAAKVTGADGAAFTAYELRVDDGPVVLRRYSAFVALKEYLGTKFGEQKKWLGEGVPTDSLGGALAKVTGGLGEESVVTARAPALMKWLQGVVDHGILGLDPELNAFLWKSDDEYSGPELSHATRYEHTLPVRVLGWVDRNAVFVALLRSGGAGAKWRKTKKAARELGRRVVGTAESAEDPSSGIRMEFGGPNGALTRVSITAPAPKLAKGLLPFGLEFGITPKEADAALMAGAEVAPRSSAKAANGSVVAKYESSRLDVESTRHHVLELVFAGGAHEDGHVASTKNTPSENGAVMLGGLVSVAWIAIGDHAGARPITGAGDGSVDSRFTVSPYDRSVAAREAAVQKSLSGLSTPFPVFSLRSYSRARPRVDVNVYARRMAGGAPFVTLMSSGVSDVRMMGAPNGKPKRVEFVLYTTTAGWTGKVQRRRRSSSGRRKAGGSSGSSAAEPVSVDWDVLAADATTFWSWIASFVQVLTTPGPSGYAGWLGHGHVIEYPSEILPGSGLSHFVFLRPPHPVTADGHMGEVLKVDGEKVEVLWVVPITRAERDAKVAAGGEDSSRVLYDLFAAKGHPWVFAGDRESYVDPRAPPPPSGGSRK